MSDTRPGPRSRSASGRGGKAAVGRPGEKAASAKASGPASPKALASNRAERAAERRGAIIEAALDEFVARGFTATRIDDIASHGSRECAPDDRLRDAIQDRGSTRKTGLLRRKGSSQ